MRAALIALLLIPFVGSAFAEDDRSKRVRDELEHQLNEMVKLPAASVELVFDGIDSTRYKLLEASFVLDDKPIPFTPSTKVLYAGEIEPGKHTLSATFSYEAPAVNSGSIKFKVPGKFIFTAQRGILMRVRARIEVDDGAEPTKRLHLVGNAETTLRAKLEDSLPPAPVAKQPEAEDKGAIRYGKKAAPVEPTAEEEATHRPRKRRSSVGTKVALAAPKPAMVRPAALKGEANPSATSAAAADAVAAPTQATETPSPPTGKGEEVDGGAVASSNSDGGFPLAPLAEVRPPPTAEASPPPVATKATGATGMAVFGAALAAIGLIVFALARRGR